MNKKDSLTIIDYIGYGAGSIGDSMLYTFLNVFLMFFLTTVAHISPGISGTIVAIGTIWDAIFNPIIGFLSDKVRTSMGRRRPLILAFILPITLITTLLFCSVPLPDKIKPIYYGILLMAYWTSYTGYFVPYNALGAAYTTDYDQRTVLRLFAALFNMVGTLICMVTPTIFVDYMVNKGMSTASAWTLAAAFIGFITTASVLITFLLSKEKDPPCANAADTKIIFSVKSLFKDYLSIAKLPPVKYLIVASTACLICYTLVMSDMVYLLTYNLGFNAREVSVSLVIRALIGVALLPIVGRITLKFDKRGTLIGFFAVATIIMIVLRFIGVNSTITVILYLLGAAICTCIYWQIMPSIYYDICDYDLLLNGVERQGTIVSFQGLVESAASGIGALLLGLILQFAGFDGAQTLQTDCALSWIFTCGTIIPILFLLAACYAIYQYPLTREKHAEILEKLK